MKLLSPRRSGCVQPGGSCFRWMFAAVLCVSWTACLTTVRAEVSPEVLQRLDETVDYLASDELEGRGVGTKGLDRAAEYIRDQFQQMGLKVDAAGGDAFQEFKTTTGSKLGEPNSLKLVGPDGEEVELTLDKDYTVGAFGGSGDFDAEIVFCGYGIDDPKNDFNEFADIDVNGKVALIMRRVPRSGDEDGPYTGPHGEVAAQGGLRAKQSAALSAGAVAVVFVNDPFSVRKSQQESEILVNKAADRVASAAADWSTDPSADQAKRLRDVTAEWKALKDREADAVHDELMEFGYADDGKGHKLPAVHVTQKIADKLLAAATETTLAKKERDIDRTFKPQSVVLTGWKAIGTVTVEREQVEIANVIGVLEGNGPLAEETIVVGAHYDHVGLGGKGSRSPGSNAVHNGADDNASGTAVLLELARRFTASGEAPPRRMVFMAFTGEEWGLLGSAHYVANPIFPLDSTVAMFNLDMVGRLSENELTVFGVATAPNWEKLVVEQNKPLGFKLTLKDEGFGPSDHSSFYGKKIPVLHFFTGLHEDYHKPSDDSDKLNVEGMAQVADLVEATVRRTLSETERPQYLEVKGNANVFRSGSRPYFGSIPDFSSEGTGYAISGAAAGSPADKGGLKGGDHIVKFGDRAITNLDDFDLALRRFSPGDEVDVTVVRDGKEVQLKVLLDKPK